MATQDTPGDEGEARSEGTPPEAGQAQDATGQQTPDSPPEGQAVGSAVPAAPEADEAGAGAASPDQPQDDRVSVRQARFAELANRPQGPGPSLDLVLDIAMPVTVELGRATMTVRELLGLRNGSVVELDRMAGEPIDLFVRDVRFARGEVVVVDNSFGLRITEIVSPQGRLEQLGGDS